jgi:hypothetical protein
MVQTLRPFAANGSSSVARAVVPLAERVPEAGPGSLAAAAADARARAATADQQRGKFDA